MNGGDSSSAEKSRIDEAILNVLVPGFIRVLDAD